MPDAKSELRAGLAKTAKLLFHVHYSEGDPSFGMNWRGFAWVVYRKRLDGKPGFVEIGHRKDRAKIDALIEKEIDLQSRKNGYGAISLIKEFD